jgi:LemA protein
MTAMMLFLLVLVAVLVILVFSIAAIYNRLITLRNRYRNAYAQIDVQLKRRYDLIPNLVETAKGYLAHERETLEAVIRARNEASQASQRAAARPGEPQSVRDVAGAEDVLSRVLTRFFALAEAYPDLKANQNMMQLSEELASTENRIAFARQSYNDSVMTYNVARERFPSNIVAGTFNFGEAQLFQVESAAERESPRISFER